MPYVKGLSNMTFAWLVQVVRIHALVPLQLTWLTALQVCRIILRMVDSIIIVRLLELCEPCALFCSYVQSWRGSCLCYCFGSQAIHCLERSALHCRIKCNITMRKRNCGKVILQISIQCIFTFREAARYMLHETFNVCVRSGLCPQLWCAWYHGIDSSRCGQYVHKLFSFVFDE